jgi:hypothetical protein
MVDCGMTGVNKLKLLKPQFLQPSPVLDAGLFNASAGEKTICLERAIWKEKPKAKERARLCEKTKKVERAIRSEKTMRAERLGGLRAAFIQALATKQEKE